jgi:hypothetical protein
MLERWNGHNGCRRYVTACLFVSLPPCVPSLGTDDMVRQGHGKMQGAQGAEVQRCLSKVVARFNRR